MECLFRISQIEKSIKNGCLFRISQIEKSIKNGCLFRISQVERNKKQDFYFKNPKKEDYDILIFINNELKKCLIGEIKIHFAVNQAKTAEFEIKAEKGEIDFYKYVGKKVEIYYNSETKYFLLFAGIVQNQEFNLSKKSFSFVVSDEKINKISNLPESTINNIGYFCEELFNEELNQEQIFNKRIETIPSDYYFDNFGNFILTNWQTKEKADLVIKECDIIDNSFNLGVLNVGEIINKIEVKFNFNYFRKIQKDTIIIYNSNYLGTLFNDLVRFVWQHHFIPAPPINAVVSAVNGTNDVIGRFNYTGLPNLAGTGLVVPQGNDYFCLYCSFISSKRFVQNVQENHTFVIKNNKSIDFFNEKKEEISFNLKIDNNNDDFENDYKCYSTPAGVLNKNGFYFIYEKNSEIFNNAIEYIFNLAKTKIYYSHNQNKLNFDTLFNADFNLSQTIEINNKNFNGKAKIKEITHIFYIDKKYGKTSISANWYKGFEEEEELNFNRPEIKENYQNNPVYFGNKRIKKIVGISNNNNNDISIQMCKENNNQSFDDDDYGYLMEEYLVPNATVGNVQAVAFKIKTPDIEKELTDGLSVDFSQNSIISIPNNDNKFYVN